MRAGGAAFIGILFFALPFPLIVMAAALIGYLWRSARRNNWRLPEGEAVPPRHGAGGKRGSPSAIGLAVWWAPVALALCCSGSSHVLVASACSSPSWRSSPSAAPMRCSPTWRSRRSRPTAGCAAPEMVDGLGLAETTPGPLILVTQFVGFLPRFREAAPFTPLVGGLLGAAMTLWVMFVPSMLWIFAGAPFVEQLRGNRRLAGALAAITAAVVGVILNLSVWFALHVLFGKRHRSALRLAALVCGGREASTLLPPCLP